MTCCDGIAAMKSVNYFRNMLKINFDYVPHYGDIFDAINTTHIITNPDQKKASPKSKKKFILISYA